VNNKIEHKNIVAYGGFKKALVNTYQTEGQRTFSPNLGTSWKFPSGPERNKEKLQLG
jgi:hypothetical protein